MRRSDDSPPTLPAQLRTPLSSKVVTLHYDDRELVEIRVAVAKLEAANAKLRAVIRLLLALVSVLGGRLFERRVPDAAHERRLLRAVKRATPALGRAEALRVLGLTPARVRDWERRALACRLEDTPTCPKQTPPQLTLDLEPTQAPLALSAPAGLG